MLPQLRILLGREFQPDSANAFPDRLLKFLPSGNVQREPAALRDLPYLLFIRNGDPARQRRLKILFEKWAKPALPKHEVHGLVNRQSKIIQARKLRAIMRLCKHSQVPGAD